ncbi:hypothetical protein [Streptacidiphilus neutrinimicus]|uniref:hypothetical protein n=1 Tax=Streptacidiphilus neutrinimicus TaxID=105420 RepID=UPI0005A8B6DC|nr:hypothetical protein [Streptacidiphilus neutrinimicus]
MPRTETAPAAARTLAVREDGCGAGASDGVPALVTAGRELPDVTRASPVDTATAKDLSRVLFERRRRVGVSQMQVSRLLAAALGKLREQLAAD